MSEPDKKDEASSDSTLLSTIIKFFGHESFDKPKEQISVCLSIILTWLQFLLISIEAVVKSPFILIIWVYRKLKVIFQKLKNWKKIRINKAKDNEDKPSSHLVTSNKEEIEDFELFLESSPNQDRDSGNLKNHQKHVELLFENKPFMETLGLSPPA